MDFHDLDTKKVTRTKPQLNISERLNNTQDKMMPFGAYMVGRKSNNGWNGQA
jgi:hypothetical protein